VHAAPPVSLSCPRGGAWRVLLAGVPALAVGVGALWVLLHLEQPAWPALLPALAAARIAWRSAKAAPAHLAWDGRLWLVDGHAGELVRALDLHAAMLLRWRPPNGSPNKKTIWLPVTARAAGPAWHGLRVAVHARVPVAEPPLHV
jgi:hypothetical protein